MGLRSWLGLKKRPHRREPERPVRVFRADPMEWTPFEKDLPTQNVVFTGDPESSDIIVASRPENLNIYGHLDRKFLIWTHEPRYALITQRSARLPGVRNRVHAMTALNGRIYRNCFYYGPYRPIELDDRMRAFREKPRRAVLLATYRTDKAGRYGWPLIIDGRDIDLNRRRQDLGLALHARGACDLYGRNWPADIKCGESRDGEWWSAKMKILEGYKINLALENTIIPYYVTEKLWDAIVGATLPVYHGAENRIYELFPKGSFIEASGTAPEMLAEQILSMPESEMEARYELCLRAYVEAFRSGGARSARQAVVERTIGFIHRLGSDE